MTFLPVIISIYKKNDYEKFRYEIFRNRFFCIFAKILIKQAMANPFKFGSVVDDEYFTNREKEFQY